MSLLRFDFEGDTKIFENPLYELVAYDLAEVLPIMKAAENAQKSGKYVAGFVSYEAAPAFRSNLKTKNRAKACHSFGLAYTIILPIQLPKHLIPRRSLLKWILVSLNTPRK